MKNNGEVDNGLRLLVKTSVFIFVAFVLSKIFGYLYRIIIARYFGPEIYGLFSLSIIIVGWFVAVSSLGFVEGMVRYVSFYRGKNEIEKIRYLFRFSSAALFISTLVTAAFLFLASEFISLNIFNNPDLVFFLKIFGIMLPFWVFGTYFLSIMRAFEKIKESSAIDSVIQNIFKLFFLVFLIFLGFNSNAIIFSFFSGILILFSLSYYYCKKNLSQIFVAEKLVSEDKRKVRTEFFSYSWPMLFLGIISSIFYWIDSFFIGIFKSVTEVGIYNAIIPMALLFNIAPEIFMQLFFPMMTKEYASKKTEIIMETSKQIGKWVIMINLPALILFLFFPSFFINILFGLDYVSAANSLRILSLSAIMSSVFIISNNLISMVGKSRVIFYDMALASAINIVLNIMLVPLPFVFGIENSSGINGAAISTAISVSIFNLLFLIQAKKYTGIIPLKKEIFNVLFAAALPALAVLLLIKIAELGFVMTIFLILAFLLSYAVLLALFGAFDEKDKMIIKTLKNKVLRKQWK